VKYYQKSLVVFYNPFHSAKKWANTACTGQLRGFARTFEESVPTADSASGGFVRQVPPLPLSHTVNPLQPTA